MTRTRPLLGQNEDGRASAFKVPGRTTKIEKSLWNLEAQVSTQRTRVERMLEQRLATDRAQAVLEDLLGVLRGCQAERAAFLGRGLEPEGARRTCSLPPCTRPEGQRDSGSLGRIL